MEKKRNSNAGPSEDVREAIDRIFPNGLVELSFDSDESYFADVYPKLEAALRRIKGAQLAHEREPDGGPIWFEPFHSEDDPPDDQEPSRSYHLFFVCPEGKAFSYETEIESVGEPDGEDLDEDEDNWPKEVVAGDGRTGWSIAVSLLAPFAVIALSDMLTFEDGSFSEPPIEPTGFTEKFERIDPEAEFRIGKGEKAFAILVRLRERIRDILSRHGIGVIPEEECQKTVSGLRADEEVLAGVWGEPLRVLDALFFESM